MAHMHDQVIVLHVASGLAADAVDSEFINDMISSLSGLSGLFFPSNKSLAFNVQIDGPVETTMREYVLNPSDIVRFLRAFSSDSNSTTQLPLIQPQPLTLIRPMNLTHLNPQRNPTPQAMKHRTPLPRGKPPILPNQALIKDMRKQNPNNINQIIPIIDSPPAPSPRLGGLGGNNDLTAQTALAPGEITVFGYVIRAPAYDPLALILGCEIGEEFVAGEGSGCFGAEIGAAGCAC